MRKTIIIIIIALVLTCAPGVTMQKQVNAQQIAKTVQARGVWHRPNVSGEETTLKGVCSVLDEFAEAGVNMVFVETFFHGMTVYKTNLIQYYKGFENYDYGEYPDYLTAFVAEAKKRGIQVHAWVQDFYIGISEDIQLVKYHPDWLLVAQDGGIRQTEGKENGGYIFLDPANPEVTQYLVDFYDDLLTRVPDVVGLNLDYIRYPVTSVGDDAGFTSCAMTEFAQKNGIPLSSADSVGGFISALNDGNLQQKWAQYRTEKVTSFVGSVFEMVKQKHPQVMLSTAIFPDMQATLQSKKQDISRWLSEGWLDVVTPMVYYEKASQVQSAVQQLMQLCGECYCYTGLYATYHSQSPQDMCDQIVASQNAGADGFVLFDSAKTFFQNADDYASVLQNMPKGAVPHALTKQDVSDVLDGVVQAAAGNDAQQIQAFGGEIEGIKALDTVEEMCSRLQLLYKYNLPQFLDDCTGAERALAPLVRALEVGKIRSEIKGAAQQPDEPDPPDDPSDTGGEGEDDGTQQEKPKRDDKDWIIIAAAAAVGIAVGAIATYAANKKR